MFNALFVIIGASLWATDTLFRHPLVNQFSPIMIVFAEHLIALPISTYFIFISLFTTLDLKKTLRAITPTASGFLGVALIGVLGSAVATVLFTYSFHFVNPTVSILLQKTQPLVVIFLSSIFLNEKLPRYFGVFAGCALVSAFFLSFPHGFSLSELKEADTKGVVLALSAALIWAVSTVIGKALLKENLSGKNMSSSVLSFWRFFFGTLGMLVLFLISPQAKIDIHFVMIDSKIIESLLYIAIIPGFLGVSLYYRGLKKVSASVATLLELSFPLCAMVINSTLLDFPLSHSQLISAVFLMASILALGLAQRNVSA